MSHSKNKKTRGGEVYDSLKHASAGMGISTEMLQEAKMLGAPGFVGSRVRARDVRIWLESNPIEKTGDDSLAGLRKKFLRVQILREEFRLQAARREHVPLAEVCEQLTKLFSELNGFMREVEDTIPIAIAGLDVPSARMEIQKRFDAMRAKIHAPLAAYKAEQAKERLQ